MKNRNHLDMSHVDKAQPVLRLFNITKRFGSVVANDDVSFELMRGEVIALLGENGAGKSTLMNILFGQYAADSGSVELFGSALPKGNPRAALDAGVGMVHQHFTLAENLTVWENIVLGTQGLGALSLAPAAAKAKLKALSESFHLDVNPNHKISRLTVGERQRVEILKALFRDAKILILDEPTAVLTPQETKGLFDTLRRAIALGLSVVFISHKLHEVMSISDRVIVLRHGKLVAERATSDTSREDLASLMVGSATTAAEFETKPAGPALLTLSNVSTAARGTTTRLKNLSLNLHAGQITGLAGVSGNGQADLSDLISGLMTPSAGSMSIGGVPVENWSARQAIQRGVARIPEDRHKTGTIADFDLTENAMLERYGSTFSKAGWINWRAARRHAEGLIETYDIRCPGPDIKIRLLSGGNMQKLVLGRVLENTPQIILANQPVRGLDIGAVNYVHGRLADARETGAAVLLISEDLDEVMKLSDVIHVMSEGRLSPAFERGAIDAEGLGRLMAGDGFEEGKYCAS